MMHPVSDAFRAVAAASHPMAVRARIVEDFQVGTSPLGTDLTVLDGKVTLDATADIRGNLDLSTPGAGWNPRPGKDPRQPYGNEVFVERGVVVGAGGDVEWVPLGYFRVYSVEQDAAPDGVLRIAGQDRMSALVDAKLTRPREFPATQSVSGVFTNLVTEVLPDAEIVFDDDTANTPLDRTQIVDKDRYAFLADLARAYGKVMYFDPAGVLQVLSAPDPTTPVAEIEAGEDGVLVEASRSLDRDEVYNAVVVEGEAPDGDKPPVRVMAYDANPDSPTYYYGKFGKVPLFYSSSNITRWQQCGAAARAMLERAIGLPYYVDFGSVPNPALEPLDPVRVRYADHVGSETHVLEKITTPLIAADPMTATTRERGDLVISIEGRGGSALE